MALTKISNQSVLPITEFDSAVTFSNGIQLGGTGAANNLSDFEFGSWTPTLARWSDGNISATYTYQVGVYTKIGRMVHAAFDCTVSAISSQGSSLVYIAGLPFNCPGIHSYIFAGSLGDRGAIAVDVETSIIKHNANNAILLRTNNIKNSNLDTNWQVGSMRGNLVYETND